MNDTPKISKTLKIGAIVLITSGFLALVFPISNSIFQFQPEHPEFLAKSLEFKIGAYARQFGIGAIYLISGIGILTRKIWARKTGLITLAINGLIYFPKDVSWGIASGFGGGKPTLNIYIVAYCVSLIWNGIFFYLLLDIKREKRDQTNNSSKFE
jgi:hypothetical protein